MHILIYTIMYPLPNNTNSCEPGLSGNFDNMLTNIGALTPTQDSSLNHVPLMMPTVPLQENGICSVWNYNLEESFRVIRYLVQGYPFVAVNTEFPAVIPRALGSFNSAAQKHYKLLRCNIDLLHIFQLGLTFMNKEGERPPVYSTWQFNLKFNLRSVMCGRSTEEISGNARLNFRKHKEEGVDVVRLGELLMISGLVLREHVKWLSYESAYDFAYLIKILTSKRLPTDCRNFLRLFRDFFPCVVDLKLLIRPFLNLKSDFQEIASYFERSRHGYQQRAGSDAILIAMIFFKMHKVSFKDAEEFFERFGHFFGSDISETNQRKIIENELRQIMSRPMLPNFEQSQLQVNNNNVHNFRNATIQTNNHQVTDPSTHLLPNMDPANNFGQPVTQMNNYIGPAPRHQLLPYMEEARFQMNNNTVVYFGPRIPQVNNFQMPAPRAPFLPDVNPYWPQMNRNPVGVSPQSNPPVAFPRAAFLPNVGQCMPAGFFRQPSPYLYNSEVPVPRTEFLPNVEQHRYQVNQNPTGMIGHPMLPLYNVQDAAPRAYFLPNVDHYGYHLNQNPYGAIEQQSTPQNNSQVTGPRPEFPPIEDQSRLQMTQNSAGVDGQLIYPQMHPQMSAPRTEFPPIEDQSRLQMTQNSAGVDGQLIYSQMHPQMSAPRTEFPPIEDQSRLQMNQNPYGAIGQPFPSEYNSQVSASRPEFSPNVDQSQFQMNQNPYGAIGQRIPPQNNSQVTDPRPEFPPIEDQSRLQMIPNSAGDDGKLISPQTHPQMSAPRTEFPPIEDQSRLQMTQNSAGVDGQLIYSQMHPQMSAPRTEFPPIEDQSRLQMNQNPYGAIGQPFPSEYNSQVSASRPEFSPNVDQSQFQMNQNPYGAIGQRIPPQNNSQVTDPRPEFPPIEDQSRLQMIPNSAGDDGKLISPQTHPQMSAPRNEFSPNVDQSQFQMNQNPDGVVEHPISTQNDSQVPNPRTEYLSNMEQSKFQINYNPASNLGLQPVEQCSSLESAQKGLWPNWPFEGEENINLFESLGMKKLPLYYPINPLPRDGWTNWMSDSELNNNYKLGQQTPQTKKETVSEERRFKLEQSTLESNFFPDINLEEQTDDTELSSSDQRLFNLEQGILEGDLYPDFSKIKLKYSLNEYVAKMAQLQLERALGQHNPQTIDSTMPTNWDGMWNQVEKYDNVPETNNYQFPTFIDEWPIKSQCASEVTLVPDTEEAVLEDELPPIVAACILDVIRDSDDELEESLPRNEVNSAQEEYVFEIRLKPSPRSGKMKVDYEHLHSNIENESSLSYAQVALAGIKIARIENAIKLYEPEHPHFWKKSKVKKTRLPTIDEEECEDYDAGNDANEGVYERSSDQENED